MQTYSPPRVTELGTLGLLTQSLLPSTRALGGTMAALSAPAIVPGGGDSTSNQPVQTAAPSGAPVGPVASGEPVPSSSPGGGGEAGGGDQGGGGDGVGDTAPGGGAAPAPGGTVTVGEGGDLPFTGFAVGALAAIGAGLTGAGVALRRKVRRG